MNPKCAIAPNVEGLEDGHDIANHFVHKYEHLYNSVPSDPTVLRSIDSK